MSNSESVTVLPLIRLARQDDEDALAGKTPILRVALSYKSKTYYRDACIRAPGDVVFMRWERENNVAARRIPAAVKAEFDQQQQDFKKCALHGWIDVQLVVMDETEYWSDDIKNRAGKVFRTFFFDAQRVTYCCEPRPSYDLEPLYSNPLNYLEDDTAREKLDTDIMNADSNENCYFHCSAIDSMPATHREAWGCIPIDPDEGDTPEDGYRKQIDGIREQLQGNVRLELPTNAA